MAEYTLLILRNNDFWVDSTVGKIWVTYQGQLLRIPLPVHKRLVVICGFLPQSLEKFSIRALQESLIEAFISHQLPIDN